MQISDRLMYVYFMRLKIGQKLLILFLSLTILSTAAVFILGYIVSSRALAGKVEEELRLSLKRSSDEVNNFLRDQENEVRALALIPSLKELFHSLRHGNHDDFTQKRGLIERFFLEYQKNREAVQAIRLVDTKGQVLIKVKELKIIDKDKTHPELPVTSVGSLFEKNFFPELMRLKKGQVWMSDFELGIDNNQFCPPMLRIVTPIYLEDDTAVGFLIINIWGQRIGEIVNNTIRKDDGYSFIVEKNLLDPERHGIYLHHPEPNICFLNQTNKGRNFFLDYPYAARLADKNEGIIHDPSSKNLMVSVYYSPYMSQERGWLMTTIADRDRVLAPVIEQRKIMLTTGVITMMAAAISAVLLSRTLTKPISLLSKGAKEIGSGNLDYRITVFSGDEIGDLARGFNSMSGAVKENINRRIEAESRACQAEKLASIGELASGVAHEINNPLGNIISTARLLRGDIGSNGCDIESIKTDIDTIIKEGNAKG